MLFKNVASQKIHVYAYDSTTGAAKTGDANNITGYVSLDGTANAIDDTNPTEVDSTNMPGIYAFDLAQAETNCNSFALYAKSSTSNIRIEPIIGFTTGAANALSVTAGSVGTGAISSGSFASGAINSAAIAADAIGASEIAADAVTEIAAAVASAVYEETTAHANIGTYGYLFNAMNASVSTIYTAVDTEIAAIKAKTDNLPSDPADQSAVEAAITAAINTAWTTTTLAEDYPTDGSAATPAELLYLILSVCSQFSINSTTLTSYKLDGTTTAATYTLDSATVPTQRVRAS